MEEPDWYQYLTQIELKEVKRISEEHRLSNRYSVDEAELALKNSEREIDEYGIKIKPFVELALKRKNNQESFEHKKEPLLIRFLKDVGDQLLNIVLVFILMGAVFLFSR